MGKFSGKYLTLGKNFVMRERSMKKTCVATLLLFLCLPVVIHSRLVTRDEALAVSARLIELERTMSRLRTTQCDFQFRSVEPLVCREEPVGYLVRLAPQGFIIMPGWTEESPAKFVCFSGDFEELRDHPFLLQLLDRLLYAKVRLNYSRDPAKIAVFGAVPDALNSDLVGRNEENWDRFLSGRAEAFRAAPDESPVGDVPPLTVSTWNQGSPYNNYTPRVGTTPTYTGCSATAQAQVMYFWKYPTTGQSSHSYSWSGQTLSADFNHEYYWSLMTDHYSGSSTVEAKDAVARLMSDVGISINMNYGTGGSGAVPNANNSLYTFFKYSSDVSFEYRSSYLTWTDWFNMFKGQADKRWPAILATFKPGSGHAVVIDGYRTTPSNQVHVNMGWGGSADAYYDMNNVYGYGDAGSDYAVVDIHPPAVTPALYITAPNGGETWPLGGSRSIAWTNTGVQGNLKLVLFQGGVKVGNIALNLPVSSGTYSWTVGSYLGGTAPAGGGYKIRAVDMNGVYSDYSDAPFSIAGLNLSSPNGGEIWEAGSTRPVTWNAVGVPGNVKLVLFQNGVKRGNIATDLAAGAGSYSWTVGSYIGGTASAGGGYTVRVIDMNGAYSDYSDAPFSIAGLNLTSPNGGESWVRGGYRAVTWASPGVTGTLKLVLFKDDVKVGNIVTDIPVASGSYNWQAGSYIGGTAAAGSGYRIRAITMTGAYRDDSDGSFSLAE
jgi:hypothetical protein